MQTLESIKRKIDSAADLQSIVRTMKALAAVSIRQYEKAVESLAEYNRTVEMGLQVVLKNRLDRGTIEKPEPKDRLGTIIFGSDQGMCGPLNEQIVTYALETMAALGVKPENRTVLAVGERAAARLENPGQPMGAHLPVPTSVAGITTMVQDILMKIGEWESQQNLSRVILFYNRPLSGASYRPHMVRLLPVNREWLHNLERKEWPSHALPTFTMDWNELFSALIRQYLFVCLYRAFAESLASENASRLASMQVAERNIKDYIAELNSQFHHQRQISITGELLDIVSGFEALTPQPLTKRNRDVIIASVNDGHIHTKKRSGD